MAIKHTAFGFLVVSVLGVAGCFSAAEPDKDRGGDEPDMAACENDNDCKGSRVCESGECVDPPPPPPPPATGGAPSTGGAPNTGGTPATGGSPNTGGTPATGGSPAGGSPAGGEGGSTPTSCTSSSPILCPNTTSMQLCVSGSYQTYQCSTACNSLGFATGPCSAGIGCDCGTATDQVCATGATAFGVCAEWAGATWTDADTVDMYVSCHTNDPADTAAMARCFQRYVSGTTVDCEAAITYCIP